LEDAVPKIVRADEAVALIRDNDTVYFGGSGGGHAVPEHVIGALSERFAKTGSPKNLFLASTVSIGDWKDAGFSRLAAPGLVRRNVSGGLMNSPALAKRAYNEEIEAYTLPQGVMAQLTREMAAGRPGLTTKVGLHTFVDPRIEGGRQSKRSPNDMVSVLHIGDEEYLHYKAFPVNVAVIRGTTADEAGNITMEDEAFIGENISIAAAAKRSGGIVIAQVKRVAEAGTLNSRNVRVPGIMIDYIVIDPHQLQTYLTPFSPAYAGLIKIPTAQVEQLPFDVRKIISRRASMEIAPGAIVNIGAGVSNGIPYVLAEENCYREVCLTNEQGVVGGLPAPGADGGAGINYSMLSTQPDQFDYYDGGGLDIAFLSFAEVSETGDVNVSRFGDRIIGPGGFINISQGAKRVVFSGTLTAGGLRARGDDSGKLVIEAEGETPKWVEKVQQITFSGRYASDRGQDVMYITERAVFRLEDGKLTLIEIAPGISLERDVLAQIKFKVNVSPALKTMDARIFRNAPMGIAAEFRQRPAKGDSQQAPHAMPARSPRVSAA
jgi:propionate CoA-transferase